MIMGQGFFVEKLQGLKERLKGLNVDWPRVNNINMSTENGITTITVCYKSTKCVVHTKKKDDGQCYNINFLINISKFYFENHSRC